MSRRKERERQKCYKVVKKKVLAKVAHFYIVRVERNLRHFICTSLTPVSLIIPLLLDRFLTSER